MSAARPPEGGTPMSGFFNDGSADAPKLRVYLNLDTLLDLRADSLWTHADRLHPQARQALRARDGFDRVQLALRPASLGTHADRLDPQARDALLARDGFDGVQRTDDGPAQPQTCLPHCGASRIDQPAQADAIVARHVARGDRCLTLHAGTGLEDDAQASRLVEALLTAADKHRFAVFLETHRATITQDLWRTVQLVRRFPELRLNGDFSHYYCGQEMTYGDWPAKLAFMEPIFARTGFLHGRIASPGCMQVPITAELARRPPQAHGQFDFLAHFRALWSHAIRGFVQHAGAGDVLVLEPELL